MTRTFLGLALAVCGLSQAATVNTTLTVNASGSLSGTGIMVNGTANLTSIGSGTISGTVSLTPDSSGNFNATFTITLSGGTITGVLKIPAAALTGSSGTATATVTGGTAGYASGSFSLTGTGSLGATGIKLNFTGPGTITTGSGGGGGTPTPTITAVLDAGAYTSNVAQGSIFVVKGSNLSPASVGTNGYLALGFPLPTSSNGVSITFTPAAGGSGTNPFLIYLYNQNGVNQLAAVLPSTVATGNYNVTVTNNGATSAPFATQVVARKVGLITVDSSGNGMAVIQAYTSSTSYFIGRYTNVTSCPLPSCSGTGPVYPGSVLVAWGTGIGAVTGGDNVASPGFNFAANGVNVQVIVGGMSITPAYAGRAPGLAGADQINLTLPANVPTGCTVSFQLSVNGTLSNPSYISIAPDANTSACVAPGYTTAQLQAFDQGGSVTSGGFEILQISESLPQFGNVSIGEVSGGFVRVAGFELASVPATAKPTPGACQVSQSSQTSGSAGSGGLITSLDAGAVTLTGPSGSNITGLALTETIDAYSATIGSLPGVPGGNSGTIVAGTYTLKGAGGQDVGAFTASVTLGSPLNVTGGLPGTVTRSAGLTLNWTGGNASDLVEIFGSGTSSGTTTSFVCFTTAGAGSFTVPASILQQLPAVTLASSAGFLAIFDAVNPTTGNGLFSAPLTAGGSISNAAFLGLSGQGEQAAYQ